MCEHCGPDAVRRSIADAVGPQAAMTENDESLTLAKMAEAMGLDPRITELAQHFLDNGHPCHRCNEVIKGEAMNTMFAFTADSPLMDTPSPPTILCAKCGYLTAQFMGIQAAARVCERNGWTP